MELTIANLRNDYVRLCEYVTDHGAVLNVRGQQTYEVTGVTLVIEEVADACLLPVGVNRKVNTRLAALEALSLIAGHWPHQLITSVAPGYTGVLVSGDDAHAAADVAYGPRTFSQIEPLLRLLRADPTTRQAVLSIWRPADLTRQGDKPCTVALQFLRRRGRLDLHSVMRSQDVWLGLALDGFMFTQLQHTLAGLLDCEAGRWVHHVGSFHAYERDLPAIDNLHRSTALAPDLPRGVTGPLPRVFALNLLLGQTPPGDSNEWYRAQVAKVRQAQAKETPCASTP